VIGLGSGVRAIAAGGQHTCALTAGGGVKCWGWNYHGQLGDGTTTNRNMPVDVSGLGSGVVAIAAGGYHTCALTVGGGVKCWGWNYYGQLGDGTTTSRTTPVDVGGLTSGVVAIAAGRWHTCALTTGGGVKCWGLNDSGQLGDGTTTDRTTPVDVSGLGSGVSAIAAGDWHTCALTAGGGVKCWGQNSSGQLGDGTTTSRTTPVDVSGLGSGVSAIAAGGSRTCALTAGGGVKCWGSNGLGQLGDGTTTSRNMPVDVSGLGSGVRAIAAGVDHTCALTASGGIKCWGNNTYGQLGIGKFGYRPIPADVSGLGSGVSAIAAGDLHTCALTAGGVKCWGANRGGQLGNGMWTDSATSVDVSGLGSGVRAIAAGDLHTCALRAGGVKCWGRNSSGQLGDGTTTSRTTPVDVSGLGAGMIAAIATGGLHTCALTAGGGVKCWGSNLYGQLGDGTTTSRNMPVDVSGLGSGVVAIAAGRYHTCALTAGGGVKCWGWNYHGQLGDGTTTNRTTPVDVSGLGSGVVAIAAGRWHTCALTAGGGVKCWGWNYHGQLGDGTTTNRTTPVDVSGLGSGVVAIAAGRYHTCALTVGGGVKCWGQNYGQLGDGTTADRTTPVDVSGLGSGVVAIAAGEWHTCALTAGGGVKCWGQNSSGQLGDGTTTRRTTPVDVSGLGSGVVAIAAGSWHTCALTTSGGVKCWGRNTYGQLGDGEFGYSPTPVDVVSSATTSAATNTAAPARTPMGAITLPVCPLC
jgi:alpha-tubulin suppressor-like RCC1 family protein